MCACNILFVLTFSMKEMTAADQQEKQGGKKSHSHKLIN